MLQLSFSLLLLPVCVLSQMVPRVLYAPNSYEIQAPDAIILPERYATFPVDWNDPSGATFSNRFWTNDTFYELGGPVFIYDAGAGDAADAVMLLTENGIQSAVMQLARAFHGAGVVMEHRYYGKSIPFVQKMVNGTIVNGTVNDLKPEQWAYHTLDQALSDLDNFPLQFNLSNSSSAFGNVAGSNGLLPDSTPYVVVGGGIGGVRAAMSRLLPSHNIFASWASSAPVQAQIPFPQYFDQIEKAIPASNCSTDIIQIRALVDQILAGNSTNEEPDIPKITTDAMKSLIFEAVTNSTFNLTEVTLDVDPDALSSSVLDLTRNFLNAFSFFQSDGVPALALFCDDFETQAHQAPPNKTGLVGSEGVELAMFDFLASLNRFGTEEITLVATQQKHRTGLQKRQSDSGADSDDTGDDGDDNDDNADDSDTSLDSDAPGQDQGQNDFLSWQYQYCTQFGFFMASDPANKNSLQSQFVSNAAIQAECTQTFKSIGVSIPAQPQISQVLKYGGWNMTPAQTFFTHGLLDPWRAVTVGSDSTGSPNRLPNKTIPAFNQIHSPTHYFGMNFTGVVHAQDMVIFDESSAAVKNAFNQSLHVFSSALELWLESFNATIQAAKAASTASNTAVSVGIPSWMVAGCAGAVSLLFAL